MRREPVSQPKHLVWVWKRSVWITYHLNIWNGSKAGDKNVSFDLCNWTYGTRIISSSLIHTTATLLNQRSRKQELEIYNSCETYMLKKWLGKYKHDFQPALIDLALFSDKITNITEYLDITGEKRSARNYKNRTWPSVTQTVDLILNRLLRVKCAHNCLTSKARSKSVVISVQQSIQYTGDVIQIDAAFAVLITPNTAGTVTKVHTH